MEPAICIKAELHCGSTDKEVGGTLLSVSSLGWRDEGSTFKALTAQREDWSLDSHIPHKYWLGMAACL